MFPEWVRILSGSSKRELLTYVPHQMLSVLVWFLAVLGMEPRALNGGKCFAIELYTQTLQIATFEIDSTSNYFYILNNYSI
jgi:hypothetical protein